MGMGVIPNCNNLVKLTPKEVEAIKAEASAVGASDQMKLVISELQTAIRRDDPQINEALDLLREIKEKPNRTQDIETIRQKVESALRKVGADVNAEGAEMLRKADKYFCDAAVLESSHSDPEIIMNLRSQAARLLAKGDSAVQKSRSYLSAADDVNQYFPDGFINMAGVNEAVSIDQCIDLLNRAKDLQI
jgi:hypothetical protein